MNKPETILSSAVCSIMRRIPADIPASSPYYDRLRALNDRICFVAESSPEYRYLLHEIETMEKRALERLDSEKRFGIYINGR